MHPLSSTPVKFPKEVYEYGKRADGDAHGHVLTKPHIVNLILDLAGYKSDIDLGAQALLEPACGHGAFLIPAVERLITSARTHGRHFSDLGNAIAAFDIEEENVKRTRTALIETMIKNDVKLGTARKLAEQWVKQDDFLLAPITAVFDYIVGNPPYIRIEQLSKQIESEYRRLYTTLFDRADIYVAFIERSLQLLSPNGALSFICADRWTLNRYGAPLRRAIVSDYEIRAYIDLHHASPFESEVIAYPSIFVIARERTGTPVRVFSLTDATTDEVEAVKDQYLGGATSHAGVISATYTKWFNGEDPWIISSPEQLEVLNNLENKFPLLEERGSTLVRIGVATGNDSIYIVPKNSDIESSRLLPLVMRSDIREGNITNAHRFVINTHDEQGVVNLSDYPRLKRYIKKHEAPIKKRHVAQKSKEGWFRTIDRTHPNLVTKPKLLIPDIAGSNEVVFDPGLFYPHHNLYFIISEEWDMEVLGALLSSRIALFFIWSYSVKMRGGYLRFQAQYLRRIRVPQPESLSANLKCHLKNAFRKRDFALIDELSKKAYGLQKLPEFDFVDARR
ncbi:MAG: Eco57I restriction-modification methylase domain-containing protein [Patescibacteria group bacterium]